MPAHCPSLLQDVGLIFLSAMASSIAMLCEEAGRDAATALGTSLLTMTISTFCVGLGTMAVGEQWGPGREGGREGGWEAGRGLLAWIWAGQSGQLDRKSSYDGSAGSAAPGCSLSWR